MSRPLSDTRYVYGTAMTWGEWRAEWEDADTHLDFHTWFCRQLYGGVQ